jgi:hypothetical protein
MTGEENSPIGKEDQEQGIKIEELLPPDVYTFAKSLIPMMYEQAWIYMGLTFHPLTRKIEPDMEQARFAIDCASFLFENLSPRMQEVERKQFDELLTNLRLNYLSKLKG